MKVTVGSVVKEMGKVMFDPVMVIVPDDGVVVHPFDSAYAV